MIEMAVVFRRSPIRVAFLTLILSVCAGDVSAQGMSNHDLLLYVLLIIAAVLLVGAVMQVADNYLRVESRKHNVDSDGLNLLGAASLLFGQKLPDKLKDASVFILKRGYDIKLEGEV